MAYRIIYPKRLQVFAPVDHDGKLQGRLILDWDQYGIFSKESYLDLTLVPRRGRWQVQDITRHDIDVFYLESFKIALNFYLRKRLSSHLMQGIASGRFQTYHFESVFFDISKHRYRFFPAEC